MVERLAEAQPAHTEEANHNREVVFVINLYSENDPAANYAWREASVKEYILGKIRAQYPDCDVIYIHSPDKEFVNARLQNIMDSGSYESVRGLYVSSHGSSGYISGDPSSADSYYSFGSLGEGSDSDSDIFWGDHDSVNSLLGPIVGRFSNDASVYLGGCSTLYTMDPAYRTPELEMARMKSVADTLGLENGALFMATSNLAYPELSFWEKVYMTHSFVEPHVGLGGKLVFLFCAAFPYIAYPISKINSYDLNEGKILVLDGHTSKLFDGDAEDMWNDYEDAMSGTPILTSSDSDI